jgi:hypothetical protein
VKFYFMADMGRKVLGGLQVNALFSLVLLECVASTRPSDATLDGLFALLFPGISRGAAHVRRTLRAGGSN